MLKRVSTVRKGVNVVAVVVFARLNVWTNLRVIWQLFKLGTLLLEFCQLFFIFY